MDPLLAGGAFAGLVYLLTRKPKKKRAVLPTEPERPVDIDPVEPVVDDDPDERLAEIDELLRSFVSDTPQPGYFYLIREGDTLVGVTREALDTIGPHTDQARLAYIYCLSSSPWWNMRLYGTPSTTKSFPKEYLVPIVRTGVRVAFMPRNENAMEALLDGFMPQMSVDAQTGAPRGAEHHYGLLWLPPVDPESLAAGEPTCSMSAWEDGSSTIDPPPQLFELLETR